MYFFHFKLPVPEFYQNRTPACCSNVKCQKSVHFHNKLYDLKFFINFEQSYLLADITHTHIDFKPFNSDINYGDTQERPNILSHLQRKRRSLGNDCDHGWISEYSATHNVSAIAASGELIILFPGEWHNYSPDKESGWQEYWIGFKGIYMENLIAKRFFSIDKPVLELGISNSLLSLYEDLLHIANEEKSGFQIMLAGLLHHITSTIFYKQKNRSFENTYVKEKLDEARRIMKSEIENPLSPEEIASQLGLGYSWFRKTFKEYTGVSPAQYQIQLRLNYAKELLTRTSLNITEIAYKLHFENVGQFSTFFKKREGLTPKEYRDL